MWRSLKIAVSTIYAAGNFLHKKRLALVEFLLYWQKKTKSFLICADKYDLPSESEINTLVSLN
jgi:hypothetical protein